MITYLSISVLGMEINNKSEYAGLKFTVENDKLFKEEYQIICDSFNAMCGSDIKNIQDDILKYCDMAINHNITSQESSIKDFSEKLKNLSKKKYKELEFSNIMLKVMGINISDVFETVKRRFNKYAFESINSCMEKIQFYNTYEDENSEFYTFICNNYIEAITKLNCSMATHRLTIDCIWGNSYLYYLDNFLKEYYRIGKLLEIIPTMDSYTYNNCMLLRTIIRLNYAIISSQNNEDIDIKNIIKELSVETFMFLTQNDKILIYKMKNNITPTNIELWNVCELSNFFNPQRILDINYNNILQARELTSFGSLDGLNGEQLSSYITRLMKLKEVIIAICMTENDYGDKIDEYINFIHNIDITIDVIKAKINKLLIK